MSARKVRVGPPRHTGLDRDSGLLADAFALAVKAHGTQRRPSDGRLFLEHVAEVAGLLRRLGFDEELVTVGLLPDRLSLSASPGA